MNKQKILIYLILGLIVIAGGISLFLAQSYLKGLESDTQEVTSDLSESDEVIGNNVTITITEADHKKWELRVQKATYFQDQSGARLEGVTGDFFNDVGQPIATFQAPIGEYLNDEKKVTLSEGVVVESTTEDGGRLSAPSMTWSARSDQITAAGGVEMDMGGYAKARAERCQFALDFSKVSLIGRARSEIDF